ncbi:cell wall-binding repeat-containing protein [Herbiconiux daphne]|uniref:Cell wall-binding repeat-containing protein n=1 Tax=Herbiconiux daphne TaxID=2970914 RepID=A0ABT2H7D5_9MICO|nr:cell wall-binding repeat-containing protein [Herbiconiux daphne]MCS5735845.1 cell wall-binding repeat-containing protein [Herbiconiux daphne]
MTIPQRFPRRITTALLAAAVVSCTLFSGAAAASAATDPDPGGDSASLGAAVQRIGGADRYETAAAVSARTFDPLVPIVFIASGEVFTDALSASAAAGAHGGAVLLTQKSTLPPATATELTRLKPEQIVVLGGTATIDASVETALHGYSGTVTRISGADRFAVSAAVSARSFASSRPVAYVASGTVFSDALSGSAAAGRLGGPVLLVNRDEVPTLIADELRRLAPAKIVVLGGPDTISDAAYSRLQAMAPTSRVMAADRFGVSAAVSADAFPPGIATVYVASGSVYSDALAGSAAAIADAGPVLLVTATSVPAPVRAELDRLHPRRIVVLGGTNSISDATLESLRGSTRP